MPPFWILVNIVLNSSYEGSIVWTELPQPDPYSVSNIGNWPIPRVGGPRADLLEQYILFLCEINNNIPIGTFTLTTQKKKKKKERNKKKEKGVTHKYNTIRVTSLSSPLPSSTCDKPISLSSIFVSFCSLPFFPIFLPLAFRYLRSVVVAYPSPSLSPPSPVCAGGVLWHRASSSRLSAVRSSTTQACPD